MDPLKDAVLFLLKQHTPVHEPARMEKAQHFINALEDAGKATVEVAEAVKEAEAAKE